MTKVAAEPAAEAETESSQTPESGPRPDSTRSRPPGLPNPPPPTATPRTKATITRKKPPIWLYAGAGALVLVGGLIPSLARSPPRRRPWDADPDRQHIKPQPDARPGHHGPAGTASPASPSSAAPTPVIVEPLGQTSKPAEPVAAKPSEPSPSPSPPTAAKAEPIAPPEGPSKPVVQPLPPPGPATAACGRPPLRQPGRRAGQTSPHRGPDRSPSQPEGPKAGARDQACCLPTPAETSEAPTKPAAKPAPGCPAGRGSCPPAKPAAGGKGEELAALIKLGKRRLDDGETDSAAGLFARAVEFRWQQRRSPRRPRRPASRASTRAPCATQKAARLAPRKTSTQELLADALFKAKRYKEAADTCRKILKTDPGSARAQQILAGAEKQLGRKPHFVAAGRARLRPADLERFWRSAGRRCRRHRRGQRRPLGTGNRARRLRGPQAPSSSPS